MANYKDMVKYVKECTHITNKEIASVLKVVRAYINDTVKKHQDFKWKGLMTITHKATKPTRRVLNGETINVPSKIKPKIKMSK